MNILLLSTGGGGGNILRSVKTLFDRDIALAQQSDEAYAARLRRAITTRFLDTNEFSLADIAPEERLVIGSRTTGRLGARHNPDVARAALEESRAEVEALISQYSVILLVGTGGKGTGAGTILPLAQMARQQKKLVLPIFVRPSFERHEVDKRRYDHALAVCELFDRAQIRLIEILNDRGYDEKAPQPQSTVWEHMNLPIARALRGLMYVLWDLSQVDPSDLSMLFAGHGRLRVGFGEVDPAAGTEPADDQIQSAIRDCWGNPYYAFSRPPGTSLICIQGDWSNVVDAKIKGGLAAAATAAAGGSTYVPLYMRAAKSTRPWGVTALFGEYTGVHAPLDVAWGETERLQADRDEAVAIAPSPAVPQLEATPQAVLPHDVREPKAPQPAVPFTTLSEFAVAVNRSESRALALAGSGVSAAIPIDGLEVRKLLATLWFRTVVPRLSEEWQTRIFEALVTTVSVPNHAIRVGRQSVSLADLTYSQLAEFTRTSLVPDEVRPDVELLLTVGRLWGESAVQRIQFSDAVNARRSKLGALLGLRD